MIKRIEILFITIIITGVLFISGCGRVAVPEYSSSDVMLEAFDEYCMTYNISNAEVRLVDGTGETLWDARYGESEGDRLFAAASITKMFTAAVIFNLDEKALLSLDDCIDSYLPDGIVDGIAVIDGIDYSHEITVRELLSHTSGIADYFSENSDKYISIRSESYYKNDVLYDFDLALDMTRQLEAHFEPGEDDQAYYSDFNYQLLGKIIETVTGQSLEYNYDKYIISPAGLDDTFLFEPGMDWGDILPIDMPCGTTTRPLMESGERSAGGLISTVDDLSRFIQSYMDGKLFDISYFEEIYDFTSLGVGRPDYGLGLMRYDDNYELYGHTGSFGSELFYCPDLDIYIICSANNCSNAKNMNLIEYLLDCYVR